MNSSSRVLNQNKRVFIGSLYLILFVIFVMQSISLFRSYPSNPPCGQTIELPAKLHILVNCDSAQFMKDSDNPGRLVNGKSDYSDRPLFAISASVIVKLLKSLGIPDHHREVLGNSGKKYSYSYLTYAIYVIFNLLILIWSALLSLIPLFKKLNESTNHKINRNLILISVTLLICANELTKTFFWTPHTQIFNILFASSAFYLVSTSEKERSSKRFICLALLIGLGTFYYPIFALLFFVISNFRILNLPKRLLIVFGSALPWIAYRKIIVIFGGVYNNSAIDKFREFVWPIDGLKSDKKLLFFKSKILEFIYSFPLFPSLLMLIVVLVISLECQSLILTTRTKEVFYFWLIYFIFILGMGLAERRVTMGLIIYSGIALVYFIGSRANLINQKLLAGFLLTIIAWQVYSWIFTNGPLY